MTAVRTEGLHIYHGEVAAVNGLDLSVPEGTMFGFLGPNGAGKTTTISALTTVLPPTAGQAEVAGFDVVSQPAEVRRRIGIVFQESTLDLDLTAEENLRFQAGLCGLRRRDAKEAARSLLTLVDLSDRGRMPVGQFSVGMRRRLEIARGLVGAPQVLFLDEPTTGLDPQTRAVVWEHLDVLRRDHGVTLFVTTHQLAEAEHCDRIAILDRGQKMAEGTPAELKSVIGADLVVMRTEDDVQAVSLAEERFGLRAQASSDGLRLRVTDGAMWLPKLCTELGVRVISATVLPPTLDDVYLHFTGTAVRDSAAGGRSLSQLGEGLR